MTVNAATSGFRSIRVGLIGAGNWVPMGRVGSPEEMAKAALFFTSDDSNVVTANLAADKSCSG